MANLLLRYDLTLLRRSFAEGFARRRDKLLLLIVLGLVLLWLQEGIEAVGTASLPAETLWVAAVAGPVGFGWQRLIALRLEWLKEHSAVAPAALEATTRRRYLAAAHAAVALPLAAAATALAVATGRAAAVLAVAAAGYVLGLLLARLDLEISLGRETGAPYGSALPQIEHRSTGRRRAVLIAILRRQTLDSAYPLRAAGVIVAATLVLTAVGGSLARGAADAVEIGAVVLPSLLSLLLASRLDSVLIGFLPYAGYRPLSVALAVSALPAACFAAALAAVLVVGPPHASVASGVLALLYLGFMAIGIARAWLYPGRPGRSVDLQVQIELAGLVLIAVLMPPFAIVALGWRMWILHRRYLDRLWVQP
jgi:hypothetical protein